MYSGDRGGYGDALYDTRQIGEWGVRSQTSFEQIRRMAPGLEVAMLPPTPTKLGMMANGMLRYLWLQAADAIAEADRIIVIGYSIPPSDRVVRTMLRVMAAPFEPGEPAKVVLPVDAGSAIDDALHEVLPQAELQGGFSGIDDALSRFVETYCA
jgi:hypothetical protein